jgi:MOSC domain-containing protein YiiM
MKLVSVNVGRARRIGAAHQGLTGIHKTPADGPVAIRTSGVVGDEVCDTRHHGGSDQAVYVYGSLDYDWWMEALEQHLLPGTFGENLTISGLESASLSVGDCLSVGGVTLQVTAPRAPCRTLAGRMDDPGFVRRFRAAERPGAYCRVLRQGQVRGGDLVSVEPYGGDRIPIVAMFRDRYMPSLDEAALRRYLAVPIAVRDRKAREEQLAKLLMPRGR